MLLLNAVVVADPGFYATQRSVSQYLEDHFVLVVNYLRLFFFLKKKCLTPSVSVSRPFEVEALWGLRSMSKQLVIKFMFQLHKYTEMSGAEMWERMVLSKIEPSKSGRLMKLRH